MWVQLRSIHLSHLLHSSSIKVAKRSFSFSCNIGYVGGMVIHLLLHSLQNTHSMSLCLPLSPSLSFSRAAMHSVHSSSYLPPNPPSLILFIDIDASALCLHPSLSFPLILRLLLHSLLILEPPGFLFPSLHLFNSLTFKLTHKFTFSLHWQ